MIMVHQSSTNVTYVDTQQTRTFNPLFKITKFFREAINLDDLHLESCSNYVLLDDSGIHSVGTFSCGGDIYVGSDFYCIIYKNTTGFKIHVNDTLIYKNNFQKMLPTNHFSNPISRLYKMVPSSYCSVDGINFMSFDSNIAISNMAAKSFVLRNSKVYAAFDVEAGFCDSLFYPSSSEVHHYVTAGLALRQGLDKTLYPSSDGVIFDDTSDFLVDSMVEKMKNYATIDFTSYVFTEYSKPAASSGDSIQYEAEVLTMSKMTDFVNFCESLSSEEQSAVYCKFAVCTEKGLSNYIDNLITGVSETSDYLDFKNFSKASVLLPDEVFAFTDSIGSFNYVLEKFYNNYVTAKQSIYDGLMASLMPYVFTFKASISKYVSEKIGNLLYENFVSHFGAGPCASLKSQFSNLSFNFDFIDKTLPDTSQEIVSFILESLTQDYVYELGSDVTEWLNSCLKMGPYWQSQLDQICSDYTSVFSLTLDQIRDKYNVDITTAANISALKNVVKLTAFWGLITMSENSYDRYKAGNLKPTLKQVSVSYANSKIRTSFKFSAQIVSQVNIKTQPSEAQNYVLSLISSYYQGYEVEFHGFESKNYEDMKNGMIVGQVFQGIFGFSGFGDDSFYDLPSVSFTVHRTIDLPKFNLSIKSNLVSQHNSVAVNNYVSQQAADLAYLSVKDFIDSVVLNLKAYTLCLIKGQTFKIDDAVIIASIQKSYLTSLIALCDSIKDTKPDVYAKLNSFISVLQSYVDASYSTDSFYWLKLGDLVNCTSQVNYKLASLYLAKGGAYA